MKILIIIFLLPYLAYTIPLDKYEFIDIVETSYRDGLNSRNYYYDGEKLLKLQLFEESILIINILVDDTLLIDNKNKLIKGISKFYSDGDYLLFDTWSNLVYLFKKNEQTYQYINRYDLGLNQYYKIEKNNIFAMNADIRFPIKPRPNTSISVTDISNKENKIDSLPDPKGIEFSFNSPNGNIDYNNNRIAVSDFLDYRIIFYDLEGNPVDSIIHSSEKFIQNKDQKFEKFERGKSPQKYIVKQLNKYSKYLNVIQKIRFLNDSTLLVWKNFTNGPEAKFPNLETLVFDTWKKNNKGEWYLDIYNYFSEKNDDEILLLSNIEIRYDFMICNEKYLLVKIDSPKHILENNIGKTYGEFRKELNEYYLENDLKSTILIYRYKG